MVASVADLRERTKAECAYLFVVDGLPYGWVTDHGTTTSVASLLGAGAGTWASTLPSSVGPRTILRGLILPTFHESFDVKTSVLDQSQVTIKLVDYDGVLVNLLATEGKDTDVLSEDIQPGTTALGTSVLIQGGGSVNPRGRHIGIERIGPSGERGYFSCFPFTRIGPHHPVNQFGAQEEGPKPIPISLDPVIFTGRLCALYRLYRDPDGTGYTAWPDLQEQYDTGGLVWWGKLLDRGNVEADRTWSLSIDGPASLLRKTCNQLSFGWKAVNSSTVLTDDERFVAVEYETTDISLPNGPELRNSVGFLQGLQLTAAGDRDTWVAELQTIFADVASGAEVGYGPDGNFEDYVGALFTITDGAEFRIKSDADGPIYGHLQANVLLHEKVWRTLGFDPPLQDTDSDEVDTFQARFKHKPAGIEVSETAPAESGTVPVDGYWRAAFHCGKIDRTAFVPGQGPELWRINGGSWRVYSPLLPGDPSIIPQVVPDGGLPLRLSIDTPYIEGQPTVPFLASSTVDGVPCTAARYFVIRGKRQPATVLVNGQLFDPQGKPVNAADVESEDEAQVIRMSWVDVGRTFSLLNDQPAGDLERWMDARVFGINRIPIKGEWAAVNDAEAEFRLTIAPLAVYGAGYATEAGEPTPSHQVLYQLLLSTGTAEGWDAGEETLSEFSPGLNVHAAQATDWCVDAERWDMGLAIPSELVQEPDEAVVEFDNLPGGRDSAFNKQSFAFVGPYESLDVIQSIVQPRGLALTLRGNRYGVVYLAPFSPDDADFTINQASMYGDQNDPTDTWPSQKIRATNQLDVTHLAYRGDPIEGDTQKELEYRARDPGAIYRSGDLKLEISDLGLTPQSWHAPGVPVWEADAISFWETQRPTFFSRRHFLLTRVKVSRVAGQDIRPGAKVRITNPWPVNPAGSYGITDAVGIVTSWDWDPRTDCTELEVLVFAGQFDGLRVFMPIAKVATDGWTPGSATLTCEEDFLGHGEGGSDAERLMEPEWSGGIGEMCVRILSNNRRAYSLSAVYTIASRTGNAITLTTTPTDILRDTDKYIIPAEWDQQTAVNWALSRGSVLVLDTLSFGKTPTKGWPLLP